MSIKITGMNSGLDTDAIIQELVSANSAKKTSLEKSQTKLSWKQAAWSSLNSKIKAFFSGTLGNLRFSPSYKKKTSSVSNTNLASVIAGDGAVNGSQSLVVKQLAKAGYLTGGKLSDDKSVTAGTNINTLTSKFSSGAVGTEENAGFTVTVGGKSTEINLTGSASISDVVKQLNSAGVNASFDATNQRIFVNVADSGKDNDFSLTANNVNGLKALSGLGLLTSEELNKNTSANAELAAAYQDGVLNQTLAASYITAKATGYAASMQTSVGSYATVQGYYDAITKLEEDWNTNGRTAYEKAITDYGSKENVTEAQAENKEKQEYLALKEKENALTEGQSLSEADQKKLDDYRTKYGDAELDKEALAAEAVELTTAANVFKSYDSYTAAVAAQNSKIDAATKNAQILNDYYRDTYADQLSGLTGDTYAQKLASVEAEITAAIASDPSVDISDLTAMQQILTTMADNEKIYTHDGVTEDQRSYQASEGIHNRAVAAVTGDAAATAEAAGIGAGSEYLSGASATAVRVSGTDSVIELNGAEFKSASNSFSINGLTITAKALSTVNGTDAEGNPKYEEAQLTTEDDVDGIYDMIKNFVKEYNSLIKEMDTLYNAKSAKDYEPLSSDEKDSMTDDEVEKWEKTIKDALLRHDSELGDIRNVLKTAMLGSFTIGGVELSLGSFGISTQGYFDAADNEKSMLHIDGNSEDSVSSGNTDKLKSLIASDPDKVTSFFTKLSGNLYSTMQKMSGTTVDRTFGNFYNDKSLANQYTDYKKQITKQETKLQDMEDRYYKMFASMETALSKINSTSSYITSMFS